MLIGLGIIKVDSFHPEWLEKGELLVTEGSLGLLCLLSETPNSVANIRDYSRILCRIIRETTIIPLRFGTLFETEKEVHSVLRKQGKDYQQLLVELDHLFEVELKISWTKESFATEMLKDKTLSHWKKELDSGKGKNKDLIDFGQRVQEVADRKRAKIEKTVLEVLTPLAKKYTVKTCTEETEAFNGVFLIDRQQEEAFDQAIDILYDKLSKGFRFKYTGPWPAHHFVSES